MATTKRYVKREELVAFLNIGGETADFELIGNGQSTLTYEYNAETETEHYIVDALPTTIVDKYAPSFENEMKCILGDPVFDYVNDLRMNLKVGTDATSEVILADKYIAGTASNSFKAQKFACTVTVGKYGGDGGKTPTLTYTINLNGNPVNGEVTVANGKATLTEKAAS